TPAQGQTRTRAEETRGKSCSKLTCVGDLVSTRRSWPMTHAGPRLGGQLSPIGRRVPSVASGRPQVAAKATAHPAAEQPLLPRAPMACTPLSEGRSREGAAAPGGGGAPAGGRPQPTAWRARACHLDDENARLAASPTHATRITASFSQRR